MKKMKFFPLAALFLGSAMIFTSCQNDAEENTENTEDTQEQSDMDLPQSIDGEGSAHNFSDSELDQFVVAFNSQQAYSQEVQQEMMQVIANDKFEMDRFNQIWQSQQNPEMEIEVSDKEMKRYNATMKKVEDMQDKAEAKMDKIVEESGMDPVKFKQIMEAAQQDQQLQMELMMKMQGGEQQQGMPQQGTPQGGGM